MRTMLRAILILGVVGAGGISVAAQQSLPATDVKADQIEATLRDEIVAFRPVVDMPIRTVDAGGHNVGVGLVYRLGPAQGGSAAHDKVTEVYYILEGAGTLVTGGTLTEPNRREGGAAVVTGINGPGVSGAKIDNGVSRRIAKGDVVIIPAGTPHWWSAIEAPSIHYIVVRVDPDQAVAQK